MSPLRPGLETEGDDEVVLESDCAPPRHAAQLHRLGGVHSATAERAVELLETDELAGLTAAEAARRLELYGPNVLRRPTRPAYLTLAVRQIADPLVALLVGAAAVSFAIGETIEASAIAAIVVLNAAFGFFQELSAARAVLALATTVERRASVVRDGADTVILAAALAPGDIVRLREGDRVPADGRLLTAVGLECDEAALTGESVPVAKSVSPVPLDTPLAERASMVYAGTAATRGAGCLVVTATAEATEQGRIATLTEQAAPPPTPLQARLAVLARKLVVLGVGITLLLALAMLARGASLREAFLVGVSVAVAAVPEGLAATVTIALALGAREMARHGAVVRELGAIETIGEATVICADKTGTLTENRLRVERVEPAAGVELTELLQAALDLAVAKLDPVDQALVAAARGHGLPDARRVLWAVPFDAERKRAGVVVADPPDARGLVKGAPETVFGLCAHTDPSLERLSETWADEGLRVLALAHRVLPPDAEGAHELDRELEPLGLVALADPLRQGASASIRAARELGLGVRMLTGDHPGTAAAIGHELGLDDNEVYPRCTPSDKLALVESLVEAGEIVVVTGDGVNDTPALRRAHVGIAMGMRGTEAAREAASIVLTDDEFSTIVAAVREGRRIAANVRSFLAFLLSANLGEVVLFAVAIVAGLGAPLTVVQVLVVNLLTDGPPAVALARDPAGRDFPLVRRDVLLGRRLVVGLIAVGAVVGFAALSAFLVVRELQPAAAQTAAFATVALAELVVVYSCRSVTLPPWRLPRNRALDLAVLGSLALVLASVYVRPLHGPLGTESLHVLELTIVLVLAFVPALFAEVLRRVFRSSSAAG